MHAKAPDGAFLLPILPADAPGVRTFFSRSQPRHPTSLALKYQNHTQEVAVGLSPAFAPTKVAHAQ